MTLAFDFDYDVSYIILCEEVSRTSADNIMIYKPFIDRTVSSLPAKFSFSIVAAVAVGNNRDLKESYIRIFNKANEVLWEIDLMKSHLDGDELYDEDRIQRRNSSFTYEIGLTPDVPVTFNEEGLYRAVIELNGKVLGKTFFYLKVGDEYAE
ncbi:hypothetical protein [Paenibacillus medicaginis]|uniref:Uncharacterized protein n=1 Tax=Paenibacillus medicaginis TaxID=1470560 RepID=A0ABV5BYG2_9BACL